jgi:outer membrane protein OmpA-like peptidoglycan-associated protein
MPTVLRRSVLVGLSVVALTACNKVTVVSDTAEPVLIIVGHPPAAPPVPEPPPPPPPPPPPKAVLTADAIRLDEPVTFEGKTAALEATAYAVLDEVVALLDENPGIKKVSIEAHTDLEGPGGKNGALTKKQAAAVRDYLVEQGVDAKRMKIKGLGETRPLIREESEDAAYQNRRIEILILEQEVPAESAEEGE